MKNNYTYKEAFEELQTIVQDIESGDIAVDELSEKIQRASSLLAICRAKLSASEVEVEKLLNNLEPNNNTENNSLEEE